MSSAPSGKVSFSGRNNKQVKAAKRKSLFHRAAIGQWRELIKFWPAWSSLMVGAVAIIAALPSPLAPPSRLTIMELGTLVLTVNGFIFTVVIAAVALIVGFPETAFRRRMMTILDNSTETPFESLAFNFIWTALVNAASAALGLFSAFFFGKSEVLNFQDLPGLFGGAMMLTLASYSLFLTFGMLPSLYGVAALTANLEKVTEDHEGGER